MRILQTAVLTVAGGIVIAFLLFELTVPVIGGCCSRVGTATGTTLVETPGWTDPWTGEIRLATETYTDPTTGKSVTTVREQSFEGHLVIPLPVGFVVGSLLTLGLIAVVRRSRTPSKPAVSIA